MSLAPVRFSAQKKLDINKYLKGAINKQLYKHERNK